MYMYQYNYYVIWNPIKHRKTIIFFMGICIDLSKKKTKRNMLELVIPHYLKMKYTTYSVYVVHFIFK